MMTSDVVTCFGCGRTLHEGDGRYHVRPAEHYCSDACIEKMDPVIARALQQWRLAFPVEPAEFMLVI